TGGQTYAITSTYIIATVRLPAIRLHIAEFRKQFTAFAICCWACRDPPGRWADDRNQMCRISGCYVAGFGCLCAAAAETGGRAGLVRGAGSAETRCHTVQTRHDRGGASRPR